MGGVLLAFLGPPRNIPVMAPSTWRSKLGGEFSRDEIERLDAEHHKILKKLRAEPANQHCAECGAADNTWVSINLGVFICIRCADVHRALGTHISKVKGCGGTYLWGPDEIAHLRQLGNRVAKDLYGRAPSRGSHAEGKEELLQICRQKYENKQPSVQRNDLPAKDAPKVDDKSVHVVPPTAQKQTAPAGMILKGVIDLENFFEDCLKPAAQTMVDAPSAATDPVPCVAPLESCSANRPQAVMQKCAAVKLEDEFDFDAFFDEAVSAPEYMPQEPCSAPAPLAADLKQSVAPSCELVAHTQDQSLPTRFLCVGQPHQRRALTPKHSRTLTPTHSSRSFLAQRGKRQHEYLLTQATAASPNPLGSL